MDRQNNILTTNATFPSGFITINCPRSNSKFHQQQKLLHIVWIACVQYKGWVQRCEMLVYRPPRLRTLLSVHLNLRSGYADPPSSTHCRRTQYTSLQATGSVYYVFFIVFCYHFVITVNSGIRKVTQDQQYSTANFWFGIGFS